jgi:enoyl-CoA hydratase/carnithine racemase
MKRTHDFAAGKIRTVSQNGTGLLVIANTERKNAITAAMWRAIPQAIHWLCGEGGARVIVLKGDGETDFSAGADISEFPTVRKDTATARLYEADNSKAFSAIRNASVPVIAAIRGICYGGGFGLAAAADLRIAAKGAAFAVPAARLGLAYPADAVQDFVQSLGTQMARKALFTGAPMTPGQLLSCGFLLDVTPPETLEIEVMELAEVIAGNAPLSVRASKIAIRAATQQDDDLLREAEVFGAATFDSADYAEGRAAFAEKRRPVFTGR